MLQRRIGQPPCEGSTALEVMIAHARDEVTPTSAIQANVPADLEPVILRCLAKRPDDRHQNAESLEEALAQCSLADQWTQAREAHGWRESEKAFTPNSPVAI